MIELDPLLKAVGAVVPATLAIVVLATSSRRAHHLFLSCFLIAIAGNQAAESIRSQMSGLGGGDPLYGIATAFASLDPFFLYCFAATFPERSPLYQRRRVLVVGAISALLALTGVFVGVPLDPTTLEVVHTAALTVFTLGVYVVCLHRVGVAVVGSPVRLDLRYAHVGLAIGVIPKWTSLTFIPYLLARGEFLGPGVSLPLVSLALGAALLVVGGIVAGAPASARAGRGPLRVGVLAGSGYGGLILVAQAAAFASVALGIPALNLGPLVQLSTGIRWTLVSVLLSVAVVRHDLFGLTVAHRRLAARALLAMAMLGGGALALAVKASLLREPTLGIGGIEALLLLAAITLSQGFRRLLDRIAHHAYGVPLPGSEDRAAATYRAAIAGADAAPDAADRARLRGELGLDEAAAARIEREVEASRAGPLEPGQFVAGRYRVRHLVARGGAGRVYRAFDERERADVVVKEIPHGPGGAEAAAMREVELARSVQHPRVVRVIDVVARPQASLLVAEYLPGGTLADRVAGGPMPASEALRALDDVLAALEAVHARGIVHRDVKPENVLFDAQGIAKLGDFGIAELERSRTASFTSVADLRGTVAYMAPEQLRGERATPATDVYALGLVAKRLLGPDAPPGVERVLAKALAADPAARWASAAEMRRALAREAVTASGTSASSRPRQ